MDSAGAVKVLKQRIPLTEGEVVDCAVMNVTALRRFYAEQIAAAKADNALFSLHLKCTMMKVSDPIMFGHCVAEYFADALQKHAGVLAEIGANVNNGLADVLSKLDQLPAAKKAEIEADIAACYEERPGLAMVDSRAGRTNLHVPSDVIIDASMPVVIRDGGKMWNKEDGLQDTVAVIPDRCYATIVSSRDRGLQAERTVRSGDHGQRVQRRAHGSEGRRVRFARQDVCRTRQWNDSHCR